MQPLLTIYDHAGRCLWCQAAIREGEPHHAWCWFSPAVKTLRRMRAREARQHDYQAQAQQAWRLGGV